MPTFGIYNGSISPLMKWYGEYTLTRTSNTAVRVDVTVTGEIKNHAHTSWMGTGNNIVVTVTVNGTAKTCEIKASTGSWYGDSSNPRSCSFAFEIASAAAGESVSVGYAVAGSGYTAAARVPEQTATAVTPALLYTPSTLTLSASSLTLGDTLTLTITRQHDFMTHTLKWALGGGSGVMGEDISTAYTWTVPVSLAAHLPAAESGALRVTCETFAEGVSVGTTAAELTVRVPADILPAITSTAHRRIDNGVPEGWGIYVQGYSKVQFAVQAAGACGSTITSVKISGGGYGNLSADGITGALHTAGVNTFTVTATDSRGRTVTAGVDIEVVPYSKPRVVTSATERCDADGTAGDEGTYARCSGTAAYSDCGGKNTPVYALYSRKAGESTWTKAADWTPGTDQVIGGAFSADYDYEIQYRITDGITSGYRTALLPAASFLLDAWEDDNGVKSFGFGGPATEPGKALFYVPLSAPNVPAVYIKSTGADDIWRWRIWSDGTAECWGRRTVEFSVSSPNGALYASTNDEAVPGIAYPVAFAAPPVCLVQCLSGDVWVMGWGDSGSETATPSHRMCAPAAMTARSHILQYYAIGTAETEESHD